jgi:hypothetical protein
VSEFAASMLHERNRMTSTATLETCPALRPDQVPTRRVLRRLGGRRGRASPRLAALIDEGVELAVQLARPRAVWHSIACRTADEAVHLTDGVSLRTRQISRALSPCGSAYAFVLTLGAGIDKEIRRRMRQRTHLGMVLDAAASVAVESVADAQQAALAERCPAGHTLTRRYSPGYCDWALEEQRKLFSLLPRRPAGVTLTKDCLMSPRKSISGVIGVGPRDKIARIGGACRSCSDPHCLNRRD